MSNEIDSRDFVMERFSSHAATLAKLLDQNPKGRRRSSLYEKLDLMVPRWRELVRMPEFFHWSAIIDSENGTCMLDRVGILLGDPVYAAVDLSIILRMFVRWHQSQTNSQKLSGMHSNLECSAHHPPTRNLVISNKYELIRRLGRGGNGDVFLVWSTETQKFYALKAIRDDLVRDPDIRRSFRNEAEAWISLGEHPNIAKAYFFEEVGPNLYITMALIEGDDDEVGPSLADKLTVGRISTEKLCVWFCQIADGLNYAYQSGIKAHRDIKPGNILINREGVAQVTDFGEAVKTDALIAAGPHYGLVSGTPLFMSPEQFISSSDCDQRSDIYSLGVTLYQAASGGAFPFVLPSHSATTPAELGYFFAEVRSLHERVMPKPIDSPLWPVIAKCLVKHPDGRFSDINAFRAELQSVAHQHLISVPARSKETTDVWVLRDQGNTFMRLGKYEKAIEKFDAFLAVIPDGSVVFNRACCLENLGHYEEALQAYKRFAKDDDFGVGSLLNGSHCLRALGRTQEALDYAKHAVLLKPDDLEIWIALGNAAFSLEEWDEAMNAYATAQKLNSSDPTPPYNLGLAALRAGHIEPAKIAFKAFMTSSMPDDNRRSFVEEKLSLLEEGKY